jgi:cytochrome P450
MTTCPVATTPRELSAANADPTFLNARPESDIPGPPPVPFVGWRGNALRFFNNPVAHMSELHRRFGRVVRLVQGGNKPLFFRSERSGVSTYFAFGPQCTRQILTDLETFQTRRPPGPDNPSYDRLSTNMFFINGGRHRQQRRLFMPAFTRDSLKAYHDDIVRYTEHMLDRWRDGERLDLDHEMHALALNIASKTFYGIDATEKDQSLAQMMSEMIFTLFSPATMIPVNLPGTPYRKLIRRMEAIERELRAEIERKRAEGAGGDDLLSMMVRAHDENPTQLTEDEMIGQAFTMFFAGHDTASKALTWTLFLLAQHPDALAELVAELDQRLGGRPPEYEELYDLPVLDRMIRESLRLLTPAVAFTREVTRDTVLGGYRIPQGSEVIYSPYIIHVDPEIYPRAKQFRPERWLEIKPSSYEYLPFGVGSRTCLGASFGGMQLRLIISMILQRFRIKVAPDTRVDEGARIDLRTNVVIGPKDGLPVTVHEQDHRFEGNRSEVTGYIREMVHLV